MVSEIESHRYDYDGGYENHRNVSLGAGSIVGLIIIVIIEIVLTIPLISAGVRRLHDTGRSGCYYLLCFVPFGSIVLLIFFIEDSQQGSNEYGPSPKYISIQTDPLVNNIQVIPVNGYPVANPQLYPVYPAVNQYPQYPPVVQNPQVPVQENLYYEQQPAIPVNQEATPMTSP